MTPIEDVFTISINSVLDKELVHNILISGYSRIPIKEKEQDSSNYIGMLLVKNLISYDTDDNLPVSHFPISVLPETYPDTSCLDILNFFQEGKSESAYSGGSRKERVSNICYIILRSYGYCIK